MYGKPVCLSIILNIDERRREKSFSVPFIFAPTGKQYFRGEHCLHNLLYSGHNLGSYGKTSTFTFYVCWSESILPIIDERYSHLTEKAYIKNALMYSDVGNFTQTFYR